MNENELEVVRGSGNIFRDLGDSHEEIVGTVTPDGTAKSVLFSMLPLSILK